MPRKLNPATLKTGHGKASPDEGAVRPSLTGAGLAGAGPNVGQPVSPAGSIPGGSLTGEAFSGHIQTPKSAHKASAIEHDGNPEILQSGNVEGALDELIGAVTKRPPFLGQWDPSTVFNSIPDWGYLKLRDASLDNYPMTNGVVPLANMPTSVDPSNVFPYYFAAPGPAQDAEFLNDGEDPRADWMWNTGLELWVGSEWGRGYGRSHIGAFTRGGDAGPAPLGVVRTARLYPRPTTVDPETGRPARVPVTISGSLFPSDRGVLALLHFPPSAGGTMSAEFLAQPLLTDETVIGGPQGRVVAALLLGNGILGDKCNQGVPCVEAHVCDGDPGGIFGLGINTVTGKYDPFSFPGRASGQYDLLEMHTGLDVFGNQLTPPWNDLNGDTVVGAARGATDVIPAPGQVRLGTDPDAGEVPVNYGIPILGGTADYFDVAPTTQLGSLGFRIQGDSLIEAPNFFRYRLPVLKDYSPSTGLKWTPRGDAGTTTQEAFRYFEPSSPTASVYPDADAVGATLRSAGFYEEGFDEDYWVWQIARYRHTYLLPSIAATGLREDVGSYWLIHFKSEKDFEKCVRDGVFPWDATDGYEVYGSSLAGAPPVHIEEDGNVVNEWAAATPPVAPDGPAPLFGYAANPYHGVRSSILLDPAGTALPAITTQTWSWSSASTPGGNESVMWSSGVAYHTPRLADDGALSFQVLSLDLTLDPGFWTSFRTDQDDLTAGVAPAVLASMNPAFVNVAPWAYGADGVLPISLDVPVGLPGAGNTPSTGYLGTHRFEVPFEYLGSNGSGTFSDANGPLDADDLDYSLAQSMEALGDETTPSFTRDGQMRVYLRRPLNHVGDDTTTLPFSITSGHGVALTDTGGVAPLLYHSTKFDKTNQVGLYGNYVVAATGAPLNTSYPVLFGAAKTTSEKFLDETFRIIPNLTAATASVTGVPGTPYTAAAMNSLVGPGMQGWTGGPIEIPTRIGYAVAPWNAASWLLTENHLGNLVTGGADVADGLQVAGLPDRNPQQMAAAQVPFPSSGMLTYPQDDFSGASPAATVHYTGAAQPDYSAATGVRQYIRAFDVAYSHYVDGSAQTVAGQTSIVLAFQGITLEDLAFAAPGPGGLSSNRIAISVKVPGLTTWMDIGRVDGAGPSKQDMYADGAGCQVVGDDTYNYQDPVTGHVGCYVRVHLGPVASLFENTGTWSDYVAGDPIGEAPLLVKVQMDVGAVDYDLEHRNIAGIFEAGPVRPGAAPYTVRGLIGVDVVHPDAVKITDSIVVPPTELLALDARFTDWDAYYSAEVINTGALTWAATHDSGGAQILAATNPLTANLSTSPLLASGIGNARVDEAYSPPGTDSFIGPAMVSPAGSGAHIRVCFQPQSETAGRVLFGYVQLTASEYIRAEFLSATSLQITWRNDASGAQYVATATVVDGDWHVLDLVLLPTGGVAGVARMQVLINGVDQSPADHSVTLAFFANGQVTVGTWITNVTPILGNILGWGIRPSTGINLAIHASHVTAMGL